MLVDGQRTCFAQEIDGGAGATVLGTQPGSPAASAAQLGGHRLRPPASAFAVPVQRPLPDANAQQEVTRAEPAVQLCARLREGPVALKLHGRKLAGLVVRLHALEHEAPVAAELRRGLQEHSRVDPGGGQQELDICKQVLRRNAKGNSVCFVASKLRLRRQEYNLSIRAEPLFCKFQHTAVLSYSFLHNLAVTAQLGRNKLKRVRVPAHSLKHQVTVA
mmetsp:Transcript_57279/g.162619  ORF Transcript_57279/g.162619 Transcript_57279/m.162619 type:complete len:218 (-) Transcript_57279:192-845(-)